VYLLRHHRGMFLLFSEYSRYHLILCPVGAPLCSYTLALRVSNLHLLS